MEIKYQSYPLLNLKKLKVEVLELRNIFTEVSDYANPIEPSHTGGQKLAKAIIEWVENE